MKYLILLILISGPVSAQTLHSERWYQEKSCYGIIEHPLEDKTKVDCLTPMYAIEYDFAHKWAECNGQALHYAIKTDRYPVCILIIENPEKDCKFIDRGYVINKALRQKYNIQIFTVGARCERSPIHLPLDR